jgi:hypothetical protein
VVVLPVVAQAGKRKKEATMMKNRDFLFTKLSQLAAHSLAVYF